MDKKFLLYYFGHDRKMELYNHLFYNGYKFNYDMDYNTLETTEDYFYEIITILKDWDIEFDILN